MISTSIIQASVENPPVVLNTKSLEESVPGPVQDSVAGGPGDLAATPPTDAISAETEKEEEQISQPEQILNFQPPSEQLPAELLDTEQKAEEQAFTVADLIEEEENTNKEDSAAKEVAQEKESVKSVEVPEEVNESKEETPMEEEVAVAQNPKAKRVRQ